jgi:hypothetical protein
MMSHYEVSASFVATCDGGECISEFLDAVDAHLVEKLHVRDVHVISEEDRALFSISILVTAQENESEGDVLNSGIATMRSAFHACDGMTPGMEPPFRGASIRQVMVREPVLV